MHLGRVFRRILNNDLEVIQRGIEVEVEMGSEKPASFHWNRDHEIVSALGPFQGDLSDHDASYLVTTAGNEVFLLYATPSRDGNNEEARHTQWIVESRVLRDDELMGWDGEDPGLLGNEHLKRVSDYHGHICPDLVIGCKAVNLGLNLLGKHDDLQKGLSVVAQNTTSAVDAIQCLTGCTLGNQRLVVRDHGKHTYTFISHQNSRAVEMRLKDISYPDQEIFLALEQTLQKQRGTLYQIARMQVMLDEWIEWLLSMEEEDIFRAREACQIPPHPESFSKYVSCPLCHDPVLASRTVELHGHSVCLSCAQWNDTPQDVIWH